MYLTTYKVYFLVQWHDIWVLFIQLDYGPLKDRGRDILMTTMAIIVLSGL